MNPPLFILLCDDLMWMSRVSATVQALGFRLLAARDLTRLGEHLAREEPKVVLVDLGTAPITEVVASIRSAHPQVPIAAFGSHVDHKLLADARTAGCDPVLSRGAFAEGLPDWLNRWASSEGKPPASSS